MEALSRHGGTIALLVGLLLGFFGLLSYQASRAETLGLVEGAVQTVLSPGQRLLAVGWQGVAGTWSSYLGLVGAATEAAELRRWNAVLERENAALREAARENTRLRRLLGLRSRAGGAGMGAEAIHRDIAHGYESLTLDRGSRDGVEVDSPVIDPGGALLGRVVSVHAWTATVQLITDPSSAVGVRDLRSGAEGVLHGTGTAYLDLAYVASLASVVEGDLIVTSGDDGIYPPGIDVGRVEAAVPGSPVPGSPRIPLTRDETALFWDIRLLPLADVREVQEVLVLEPFRDDG